METKLPMTPDFLGNANAPRLNALEEDYGALGRQLQRRGIDIGKIERQVAAFSVALPSWGAGRGGTRFAKFPFKGAPTNIHEKLQDCAVIQQLCRITPRVSPHFPWDFVSDYRALRQEATALGLAFDAVNSNTFQDQPGQQHSYASGSLTATDSGSREQAIAHNIECINIGTELGSDAITVWIGDGSNFPGQQDLTRAFDRYLESTAQIYAALPGNWRMLLEHKLFEPAFYSTVLQDWGSSILAAQQLGPKAQCLVDLGHHAPNTNIEQIVSRLHRFGKLGGFHFNDSKYGDDDLDAGSVAPYRLFLVFNELVAAAQERVAGFEPAYMLDQSHNVTDPIESLMSSAEQVQRTYAQALLVDRVALDAAQLGNDALAASQLLKTAFQTDVTPLLQRVRAKAGGAIDPVATYRASGYRQRVAAERPAAQGGGGGIV
jgi:L-rhamnose isomerase / sugar isomerase